MANLVRSLVSKKKKRLQVDGYDLDLTYITERVIAMGFPSENMEGIYRNRLSDVVRFLDARHGSHYRVYNLCSERSYAPEKFYGRVGYYPFDDHNAPPFTLLQPFCNDVAEWLAGDAQRVVVVHCKAGKGRTGVMICAWLVHAGLCESAESALSFYGRQRTHDAKGVTIPSQRRYVLYYEQFITEKRPYEARPRLFTGLDLHTVPRVNKEQSCVPVIVVKMRNTVIHTTRPLQGVQRQQPLVAIRFARPLPICGDVLIELCHAVRYSPEDADQQLGSGSAVHRLGLPSNASSPQSASPTLHRRRALSTEKLCHCWLNTCFVPSHCFIPRTEWDGAHKRKHLKTFDESFGVTLYFEEMLEDDTVTRKRVPPQTVPTAMVRELAQQVKIADAPTVRLYGQTSPGEPVMTTFLEQGSSDSLKLTRPSTPAEKWDEDEEEDEEDDEEEHEQE